MASAGGGTYLAVFKVHPGLPIQFCDLRNSPGVACEPLSPRISFSCISLINRNDNGRVCKRARP